MKKFSLLLCAAMVLGTAVSVAQPPEGRPRGDGQQPPRGERQRGEGEGRRPEGQPGQRPEGGRGGFGGGLAGIPIMVALDADRNGELSAEEISNAVAALKTLDKNNDGKVDAGEMRPAFGGFGGPPGGGPGGQGGPPGGGGFDPEAIVDRFMQGDTNGDGKLSKEEVPERMREGMAAADTNSDGFLDRAEIVAMMRARMAGGGRPGGGRPPGEGGARPEGEGRGRGGRPEGGERPGRPPAE